PDYGGAVDDQHAGLGLKAPAQELGGGALGVALGVDLHVDEVGPGRAHPVVDVEDLVHHRAAHSARAQQGRGEDHDRGPAAAQGGVEADVVHGGGMDPGDDDAV